MKILRYCVMTILSILFVAGCGVFDNTESSGDSNTVTIGALLPLSGTMAVTGGGMKAAINVGISDINRHLSVNGSATRLSVKYADTGTDPSTALAELKKFHAQGIKFVIGPGSSEEASAVLDYANSNGMLLISSSTAPSLAIEGDNLIRLCPNDTNQAKGLAMLMNKLGKTELITINIDDTYGNELASAVRTEFESEGGSVVTSFTYSAGTTDFSLLRDYLKPVVDNAVAVYGASNVAIQLTSLEEGKNILAAMDGTTMSKVQWFGSDGNANHSLILANSKAASFASDVSFISPSFTVDETALGMPKKVLPDRALRQRIYSAYGGVTDTTSLMGYDAVWLIGLSLLKDGKDADTSDVIQTIFDMTTYTDPGLAGVSGRLELTSAGDKEDSGYSFYEITSTTTSELKYSYTFSGVVPHIIDITASDISLPSVTGNTITVGVLVPKTGSLQQSGMSALKGIEDATAAMNSFYQFYGSSNKIVLSEKDTATDPDTAIAALTELHNEGVTLVTGVISSDVAKALLPYLTTYGMTLISPASTSEELAIPNDNLYRFTLSDDNMAKALAMLMYQDGKTDVTLIYRNDTWGSGLAADFKTYFEGYGGKVSASVNYTPGSTSSYSDAADAADTAVAADIAADGASKNAVLMLSYEEGTDIMDYAADKTSLSQVSWYGGDGYAKSTGLFSDQKAYSFAINRGLTCAIYSILEVGGKTVPDPISRIAVSDRIQEALGYSPITYAYTAWDSLWIGVLAYAEQANATSSTLGGQITAQAAKYIGLSNYMALDANGDKKYGEYGFFKSVSGDKWDLTATYHYTPVDYSTPAITRP